MRQCDIASLLAAGGLCLTAFPQQAHAGWFDRLTGPKYNSYEECILDRMQGVTSDIAANEIRRACAKIVEEARCPSRELTKDELEKLTGKARFTSFIFSADILNENKDLQITEITIEMIVRKYK